MTNLRIFLTTKCNMRCAYCRVRNDGRTIEWARLERYLQSNRSLMIRDVSRIDIVGGEPCLEYELLRRFAVIVRDKIGFEGGISLFTNATVLETRHIALFDEYRMRITVSLDGIKEVNDHERRVKKLNQSGFERVMRTIERMDRDKLHIHVTLTKSNYLGLPEYFSFLSGLGVKSVGLFPADYCYWAKDEAQSLETVLRNSLFDYHRHLRFAGLDWLRSIQPPHRPPCDRVYLGADGAFICASISRPALRRRLKSSGSDRSKKASMTQSADISTKTSAAR